MYILIWSPRTVQQFTFHARVLDWREEEQKSSSPLTNLSSLRAALAQKACLFLVHTETPNEQIVTPITALHPLGSSLTPSFSSPSGWKKANYRFASLILGIFSLSSLASVFLKTLTLTLLVLDTLHNLLA